MEAPITDFISAGSDSRERSLPPPALSLSPRRSTPQSSHHLQYFIYPSVTPLNEQAATVNRDVNVRPLSSRFSFLALVIASSLFPPLFFFLPHCSTIAAGRDRIFLFLFLFLFPLLPLSLSLLCLSVFFVSYLRSALKESFINLTKHQCLQQMVC